MLQELACYTHSHIYTLTHAQNGSNSNSNSSTAATTAIYGRLIALDFMIHTQLTLTYVRKRHTHTPSTHTPYTLTHMYAIDNI